MADVTKTAEVLITGNATSANAAMRSVGMAAAGMSAAVIAALGKGIEKASEFEAALAEVQTMAQSADMSAMGDGIEDLAKKYGKGAEDMARGAYDILSSGVAAADTLKYLDTVGRLSIAGRVDAATATDLLTTSTNAWGEASGGAAHAADVMFATVAAGKTRISQLAPVMGQVANQAHAMGVSMEETYAAVATLTAQGVPTAQAVTYIRGALTSILKPSKEAADLATSLGLEFNATALKAKGLAGFLQDVQAKTGGNNEQMAVLMGQVEALNGVLALVGTDGGQKFVATIDAVANSTGKADQAYATMADTMGFRTAQMKEELNAAWRAIGEATFPVVEDLSEKLSVTAGWLTEIAKTDAGKKFVVVGGEIAGALGVVGAALWVLPKLKEGLKEALISGKALVTFFKGPWGAVTIALTGITLGVAELKKMSNDAKKNWDLLSGKGELGPRAGETTQEAGLRQGREQITAQIDELQDKRTKWRGIRDQLQTFGKWNEDLLGRIGGKGEVAKWEQWYRQSGLQVEGLKEQRERLQGMAGGGFVGPGDVAIVGEDGRELAIGKGGGAQIVPLNDGRGASSSPTRRGMNPRPTPAMATAGAPGMMQGLLEMRKGMVEELGRIERGGFGKLQQTTQSYLELYNQAATMTEKRAAAQVMAQTLVPAMLAIGNAMPSGFGGPNAMQHIGSGVTYDVAAAYARGAGRRETYGGGGRGGVYATQLGYMSPLSDPMQGLPPEMNAVENPAIARYLAEQDAMVRKAERRRRVETVLARGGQGSIGGEGGVPEGWLEGYGMQEAKRREMGGAGGAMVVEHRHTFQDGVVAVKAEDLVQKTIVETGKKGRAARVPLGQR